MAADFRAKDFPLLKGSNDAPVDVRSTLRKTDEVMRQSEKKETDPIRRLWKRTLLRGIRYYPHHDSVGVCMYYWTRRGRMDAVHHRLEDGMHRPLMRIMACT